MRSLPKLLAAALGAATLLFATGTTGYAVSNSLPIGTVVTATLTPGTAMSFKGVISSTAIKVVCHSFSTSGTVTVAGPNLKIAPPTIGGCTDSAGGTDTITTNATNGHWKLHDPSVTAMKLKVPMAGATFTSTAFVGCTVTFAPAGVATINGSYNGTNTDSLSGAIPVAITGVGCTVGAWAVGDLLLSLSPSPGPVPPW
jgi:hypothetical protein